MTGLPLNAAEESSIESQVYFIPKSNQYDLTGNRAVGVAKRRFREETGADKVSGHIGQKTNNGMYVQVMITPEPSFLDSVALSVIRENPEMVAEVDYWNIYKDEVAEGLLDEMFKKISNTRHTAPKKSY